MKARFFSYIVGAGLVASGVVETVQAADVYAYPNAGQSQAQQDQDRYECHSWASRETGYDPTRPATQPDYYGGGYANTPPPPKEDSGGFLNIGDGGFFEGGGVVGDAATGAALGAAGGAIAGDAGEGALIGAGAATVFGLLNKSSANNRQAKAQAEYEQQRQAEYQYQQQRLHDQQYQQRDEYNRAFGACMRARNYTVQ